LWLPAAAGNHKRM